MSPCKLLFRLNDENKNKGFTLVELVLSMAIGSIIIMTILSLLNFTSKGLIWVENNEEMQLNGRYAIEFIKNEIKRADKIMAIEKINGLGTRYKNNIGFIIFNYDPEDPHKRFYNYVTYYISNNKLQRAAANKENHILPYSSNFGGGNVIAEYVSSMEGTEIDFDKKIIKLNFILEDSTKRKYTFKSIINIRCPVEK